MQFEPWNPPGCKAGPITDPRTGAAITAQAIPKRILTPPFLLCFPYLFKAQAAMEGSDGPGKFGVTMAFKKGNPKQDLSTLLACAKAAAHKKWGADVNLKKLRSPFRDGDEDMAAKYAEFNGTVYVAARCQDMPGVLGMDGVPIAAASEAARSGVYPGCLCRATLSVYAYEKSGNKGVAFGLLNVQVLALGKRIAGSRPAAEDFRDAADAGDVSGLVEAPADATDEPPY